MASAATVLAELAESIEPPELAAEAERAPLAWVQRLGYILSVVEAPALAGVLEPLLGAMDPFPVALVPSAPRRGAARDSRWRVVVNADVEPEV